jgi:hypothetical protein
MTELKGTVSEKAKVFAITKTVFNFMKEDGRVHKPLKVIAFNANGIGRQRHEVSK